MRQRLESDAGLIPRGIVAEHADQYRHCEARTSVAQRDRNRRPNLWWDVVERTFEVPYGRIATDVAEAESCVTPGRLVYRLVLKDARQEIGVISMAYAGERQHDCRTPCLTTAPNEIFEVSSAACRGDSAKSVDGGSVVLVLRCEFRDE